MRVLGTTGEFDAFKFRTMIRDAESILARNPALKAEFERNFKKCLGIATPPCAQSLIKAGAQDVLINFVGTSVNQIRQSFLCAERRLAEVCQT